MVGGLPPIPSIGAVRARVRPYAHTGTGNTEFALRTSDEVFPATHGRAAPGASQLLNRCSFVADPPE